MGEGAKSRCSASQCITRGVRDEGDHRGLPGWNVDIVDT